MWENMYSVVNCESHIQLFGFVHLTVFSITMIISYLISKYKLNAESFIKLFLLTTLCSHMLLYAWYYMNPLETIFEKGLPFYTCRMTLYLLIAGILFDKKSCLKLGVYWGFFGGLAGLVFPTMFKYPFPHIQTITVFMLHSSIFITGTYYLFVKKIGMNKQDLKNCSICTLIFLIFVTIFNIIVGSNYSATTRMPAHLINFGINVPTSFCSIAVISGYLLVIFLLYLLVNDYKYEKVKVKDE